MRKGFMAGFSVFLCLILCACSSSQREYGYLPVYDENVESSVLTLQQGQNISFTVQIDREWCGLQIAAPVSTETPQTMNISVYRYASDYASTVASSERLVGQQLTCSLPDSQQTLYFDRMESGTYLIMIEATSETAELRGYAAGGSVSGFQFLRDGVVQESGSVGICLIYEITD